MVNVNTSYCDLSGGEIAPKYYGRHDLQIFYKGLRRARNFITESAGGAFFRNGFYYANKTRDNLPAWMAEFRFTDATSFALEFTTNAIRFYRNDGQVRFAAQAITAITQANPAVVTYVGADTFSNGDRVWISGVVGMTQVNNLEFTVAGLNAGANTFQLSGVNSTAYTAYSSGGTIEKIMEVTTTYAQADIPQIKIAQEKNVMYLAHPSYNPKKLTYTSATSWAFADHSPTRKSRTNAQVISAITVANPAVLTYTGSDSFSNGDVVYIDGATGMTEVNQLEFTVAAVNAGANTFQLSGLDSSGYAAYAGGGIVRKVVTAAAPFLSADNYPAAVGLYERRLYYGGSNNNPNTLYGSNAGELDDFTLQINTTAGAKPEADEGVEYQVYGATRINWLRGTDKFLAVGANNDVLLASGGIDDVITPSSISIKPTNSYGAADMNAVGRGSLLYYLQSDTETMRSFEYSFEQDRYVPVDRTEVAQHITQSGIVQFDYLEANNDILWAARNDGKLAAMTTSSTEAISGWQLHDTDGEFVSICTLTRPKQDSQLWACVKRTINGAPQYNIEFMAESPVYPSIEDFFSAGEVESTDKLAWLNMMYEAQRNYIHLDSALTYDGSVYATQTITPGATTGTGVTFTAGGSVFDATMVGRQIVRKSVTGLETGVAEITAYTSATVVTCDILENFDSVTAIPIGEWYLTTDSVTNAGHLEGREVLVVADGAQHPTVMISGGVATLGRQTAVFHIGLGYRGELETNDLEGGGLNGVAQTKPKSVYQIGIRFLNSLYVRYGVSRYKLNQIEGRTANMRMDRPPVPFTGDQRVTYANELADDRQGGWTKSKRVVLVQDLPFPCYIQLVVPYFSTSN
jgi:hypothetical protein